MVVVEVMMQYQDEWFNYQGKMMLLYVLELINQIVKDKNKDIDRRLEETTKELQREREN